MKVIKKFPSLTKILDMSNTSHLLKLKTKSWSIFLVLYEVVVGSHSKNVQLLRFFLDEAYKFFNDPRIYIYIYILWECWSSVNHYVVMCPTKCNIIWREINIYDRAIIIIIMIVNEYIFYLFIYLFNINKYIIYLYIYIIETPQWKYFHQMETQNTSTF